MCMLMSVSGPNFVADPKKELAKMDQRVHTTDYRRHEINKCSCVINVCEFAFLTNLKTIVTLIIKGAMAIFVKQMGKMF